MRFVGKHALLLIFLGGLVLRLILLFLDYSFDVNNHIVWAKDAHERGFSGFYETRSSEGFASHYPNYPPLAIFLFYIVYPIQSALYEVLWWLNLNVPAFPSNIVLFVESRTFLAGLMKLPAIVADLGIAWLVYLFAKRLVPKNKKMWVAAPALFLFNPTVFYNSSFWGQIDSIPIFFSLAAFYLLLYTNRYSVSALLFVLALLVKPTALIYLPVFLVYFLWKYNFPEFFEALAISAVVFVFSFFPLMKSGDNLFLTPFVFYTDKILAAQSIPYVTNGAFNFWLVVVRFDQGIKDAMKFLFNIPYRVWGYLITAILSTVLIRKAIHRKDVELTCLHMAFFVSFAGFLFLTKMHERYYMLSLPFLLLIALHYREYMKWYIVLSVMSFLNLYHSWSVPRVEPLVELLKYVPFHTFLAFLNVTFFVFIFVRYLMRNRA